MLTPNDVRLLLERQLLNTHGHIGFRATDGRYYEGYYDVDEDVDVIHFVSGGPTGGWEQDFSFSAIDLATLIPPVTPRQDTREE